MVNIPIPMEEGNFQGQDAHEVLHFYFRQHWIRLVVPFFWMIFWMAAVIFAGYAAFIAIGVNDSFTRHGILMGLFLVFAFVQWRFLIRFYDYALYIIIVTDRKVHRVKKTLLTHNDHQTIDIWTLQDIHKSQHGVIQSLFNYGTIILESQDTVLKLHFIPKVDRIYDRLSHVRELAREHAMIQPHFYPQVPSE